MKRNLRLKDRYIGGQALLELAVFGSLLIMLLGVLINYGLRYNSQQYLMQEAFRKALAAAEESTNPGTPESVSYAIIEDNHIPNPSDIWGFGSVTPVGSSVGAITRSYKMSDTADIDPELPVMRIQVGRNQPPLATLRTAGFRTVNNVDPDTIEKYNEIYGPSNVCSDPVKKCGASEGANKTVNIKIIDPVMGEYIDYENAVSLCRKIVDKRQIANNRTYCEETCEKGNYEGSDLDCKKICSHDIEVPVYCQDAKLVGNKYYFPNIDALFAGIPKENLGLMPDYTQTITADNSLTKKEDGSSITTSETFSWTTDTKRTIIKNTGFDAATGEPNLNTTEYTTQISTPLESGQWESKW